MTWKFLLTNNKSNSEVFIMDRKKIDELVEKLLMSRFTTNVDKGDNEVPECENEQPYHDPDKPISYQDWLKQQPRPKKRG